MTLKIIVKGIAKGKIMKTNIPINFLGAVDKKTGIIRDDKHDMFQKINEKYHSSLSSRNWK